MSMYPSPYMPPGVHQYYSAPVDPLRAAKRASLLMFIVGPLIFLSGTCMLSVPSMMRAAPSPEFEQMRQKLQAQSSISVDQLFVGAGSVVMVLGVAMLVLAFFVRRGGKTPGILSAILAGLLGFYFLGNTLMGVLTANIPTVCVSIPLLGLFGVMFLWLIHAIRASGNVALAQQQYAAQYWQYQQNMQAYANAGYGYNYMQAPPVQPPALQPPPPMPQAPQIQPPPPPPQPPAQG